jgi:sulfatase maturation enzyme AslB (radical SAM superfamily)
MLRSGLQEGIPYSLSRWTDIPGSTGKWQWFEQCLAAGQMLAFDPRTGVPSYWSLRPEATCGLVFWTKDPRNLIASQLRLEQHNVAVHVTATGWEEVERGAPSMEDAGRLLIETAKAFPLVYWRFSPIPLLPDWVVLERFKILSEYAAQAGIKSVFVSFLQPNDRLPETRSREQRFDLLNAMSDDAAKLGMRVDLCQDDTSFAVFEERRRFSIDVCVPTRDFPKATAYERCGCVLMVDPFTINETCSFGCQYCYAADTELSAKKRNSLKGGLRVIR